MNKLVVATHPNSHNDLIHQIVDPTNEKENKLKINSDLMAFKYYYNIISLLENERIKSYESKYGEFIILEVKKYQFCIGILQDIYKLIKPYYDKFNSDKDKKILSFQGLYREIDEVLDKLEARMSEFNEESFLSIGIDGLIAFSKRKQN